MVYFISNVKFKYSIIALKWVQNFKKKKKYECTSHQPAHCGSIVEWLKRRKFEVKKKKKLYTKRTKRNGYKHILNRSTTDYCQQVFRSAFLVVFRIIFCCCCCSLLHLVVTVFAGSMHVDVHMRYSLQIAMCRYVQTANSKPPTTHIRSTSQVTLWMANETKTKRHAFKKLTLNDTIYRT